MSDRAREELGILASLTAAIETTQTDITNIDIQVQEDICRGNVRMSIPLNEVTRLEHARVEMDQAKLTETRLQVDLGIEIEMTDTNASDTSQSVTRDYGEGRTDLTAGQERDTAADQSAQRPRSDGKDESTGESHSENGYQDRTTTRRSFSNSDTDKDTDTSTKGNDTSPDPSGQPAKTEPEVDDSAASEMVSEDDRARYRDPEKLAAVYHENATFNEMKEALGVEVTAQTVRKYMIEYGIHEPKPRPDRLLETIRVSELELMNGEQVDQTTQADNSADAGSESAEK